MLVPANAFASHDLGIYKAEKQVDVESDSQSVDVYCGAGDYALDGMWRVDHADQDDDDLYVTSIGRALDVLQAYPEASAAAHNPSGHLDGYHFLFEKNAIGRAQAKVFVVCIKQKTEQAGGHSHKLTIVQHTAPAKPGSFTTAGDPGACTGQSFIAQTGFSINYTGDSDGDPAAYLGHVSTDIMGSNMKDWTWYIDLSQDHTPSVAPAPSVDYYWSCVSRKVQAAGHESHKLVYKYDGALTPTVGSHGVTTARYSCKADYKAVVAGFDLGTYDVAAGRDPNPDFASFKEPYVWYLGMDPQPKSRNFKFLNSGSSTTVTIASICLNYRTT